MLLLPTTECLAIGSKYRYKVISDSFPVDHPSYFYTGNYCQIPVSCVPTSFQLVLNNYKPSDGSLDSDFVVNIQI